MAEQIFFDANSNIIRFILTQSVLGPDPGEGLTGLTFASTGLQISTICQNEATATSYTAALSKIETITTLGTYAAPTSTKCRFKEVDATYHPGLYEVQFADARFAIAGARSMVISVAGAVNLKEANYQVQLTGYDPYNPASLSEVATEVMDLVDGIESGVTLRKGLRGMVAALLGKSSGHASNAPVYRDTNDTKNVIAATTDSSGNRSAVTLTLT